MSGLDTILGVPDALKKLEEGVEVVTRLASKLKADPDAAAAKLADALGEIEKTCGALDDAFKKYLQLAFETQPANAAVLLEISGGGLVATVERGRGHCHEIGNIYTHYLNRWFDRVFRGNTQERAELRQLFETLGDADRDVFQQMIEMARVAQKQADVVLAHLSSDQVGKARAELRTSYTQLNPLRVRLNELLARLLALKAQFIQIAGIPPAESKAG